jgi:hypothetical protein
LVERFFNKIKQCRRVATRYDKLAANYLAFIQLASIRLWLRKSRGGQISYVNAGNYAVIEVRDNGAVAVECRLLARNYVGWTVVPRPATKRPPEGALIPEDRIFGDNIRFPKASAARRGRRP